MAYRDRQFADHPFAPQAGESSDQLLLAHDIGHVVMRSEAPEQLCRGWSSAYEPRLPLGA